PGAALWVMMASIVSEYGDAEELAVKELPPEKFVLVNGPNWPMGVVVPNKVFVASRNARAVTLSPSRPLVPPMPKLKSCKPKPVKPVSLTNTLTVVFGPKAVTMLRSRSGSDFDPMTGLLIHV